jgi:hypothetical protein
MYDIRQFEDANRIELKICESSDWQLFENIAHRLEQELKGVWVEKIDGPDQRYWDLKIEHEVLTLHLEHYLGISLYAKRPEPHNIQAINIIENARKILSAYASAA